MRNYGREFVVGTVFFLLLVALGVVTLALGADVLESTEGVVFRFDNVAGLSSGSEVWINGLPSGTVREVGIASDGTVTARARMKNRLADLDLSGGARVEVKDKSSLGGSVISVEFPRPQDRDAPKDAGALQARTWTARVGGFSSIGETLVTRFEKAAEESPGFLGKALIGEEALGKLNRGIAGLEKVVGDIQAWVDQVNGGQSALAVLLKDPDTAERLRRVVASVEDLTSKARQGEGLLGKLIYDAESGRKFEKLMDDLSAISADARAGKGTLGKLIADDALYNDARAAVADLREFTGGLNGKEGLLYRLINDRKMAEDLSATFDKASRALDGIQTLVADVKSGKGTLGRIVADEALYNDVRDAVRSVQRSFEEARENAPILTFAGFLFRTF